MECSRNFLKFWNSYNGGYTLIFLSLNTLCILKFFKFIFGVICVYLRYILIGVVIEIFSLYLLRRGKLEVSDGLGEVSLFWS